MTFIDYIHPDDVFEQNGEKHLKIPPYLIKIVETQEPDTEYKALSTLYPELTALIDRGQKDISETWCEKIYGPWTEENGLELLLDRSRSRWSVEKWAEFFEHSGVTKQICSEDRFKVVHIIGPVIQLVDNEYIMFVPPGWELWDGDDGWLKIEAEFDKRSDE